MRLNIDIEVGSVRVRKGRLWLPDGLHVWINNFGVHVFWAGRPHVQGQKLADDLDFVGRDDAIMERVSSGNGWGG